MHECNNCIAFDYIIILIIMDSVWCMFPHMDKHGKITDS